MLFKYEIKNDKKACNYFLFCGGYKYVKTKTKLCQNSYSKGSNRRGVGNKQGVWNLPKILNKRLGGINGWGGIFPNI